MNSLFIGVVMAIATLMESIFYDTPFDTYVLSLAGVEMFLELGIYIAMFFFLFHSLWLMYKAATALPNVSKSKAVILFLLMPCIVYI